MKKNVHIQGQFMTEDFIKTMGCDTGIQVDMFGQTHVVVTQPSELISDIVETYQAYKKLKEWQGK